MEGLTKPLLVCSALMLVSACEKSSVSVDEDAIACGIISDFVESEFDQADGPLYLDLETGLSMNTSGRFEPTPNPKASYEGCESLLEIRETRSFKRQPVEVPDETEDGLFYAYDTLVVTWPQFANDGQSATLLVARSCGPLCGSIETVTYERRSIGGWQKASKNSEWIS